MALSMCSVSTRLTILLRPFRPKSSGARDISKIVVSRGMATLASNVAFVASRRLGETSRSANFREKENGSKSLPRAGMASSAEEGQTRRQGKNGRRPTVEAASFH